MHITDLIDPHFLHQYITEERWVRTQNHPTLDLKIYNYTEKAQFDQHWDNITSQCRGLITNSAGTVIARPFEKFHNYNPSDSLPYDQEVIVTDKMDGSLGISYIWGGQFGIATRGSFDSEQARHATNLLNTKYADFRHTMLANADETFLFEIIYPANRIVVDYGDWDDLVLLGSRNIEDGSETPPEHWVQWKGPKTRTFPYKSLREALEAPQRPNAEGLVVYFVEKGTRVKIKQDDYVALHKIVTGLTERRVWEIYGEGKSLQDMLEIVPDEWHTWLAETYNKINSEFLAIVYSAHREFQEVMSDLPLDYARKDFAFKAKNYENPSLLFSILDGRNIFESVWKMVKPSSE